MRRLLIVCLLSFSVSAKLNAQNSLPRAFEVTADTVPYITLPRLNWQILEDKDGALSFEQVFNLPVENRFRYEGSKTSELNYSIHAYWFRYVLKNAMNQDANICFGDSTIFRNEESDFYFVRADNKITHEVNGFLKPWSELTGIKEYRLIPIKLKPGEQIVIYRRIYNTYRFGLNNGVDFQVGFFPTERAMQLIYRSSQIQYFGAIHDIFIVGVLAFASLFIFFFYIIIWEKVYLYFSLYLFSLSIGRFNTSTEMYDVFFREHPLAFAYIFGSLWFFSIFFLIYFIRSLLNIKRHLPIWNKVLVTLNLVYAVTYFLALIIQYGTEYNKFLSDIVTYEQLALTLSIPIVFFISVKWYKENKVLTFIVLPLQSIWAICWSIVIYLITFNPNINLWLVTNWYSLETILLGCLVISFSWILLQRFGDLKKQIVQKELEKEIERRRLIIQQKIDLEEQVEDRTIELRQSLEGLKATQSQLIQSEKMASLGELTAGIAHEIQNPLNFVNNFSEVNKELLVEMNDEIEKGNYNEVKSIAKGVTENEEKIIHHGKRADAIVKAMLQHSRSSTGVKEPTDINALADEYLRLSYHGLRAKDKLFNATLNTDYDKTIGEINIIPQDIGRVLLNLYNNAFYAITEKRKQQPENYDPTVSVSTKKINDKVELTVKDNGSGILQKVVDKIFQPFFTTKPTGEGTGLGLSLSYDIIKAHGGEIKVNTIEGEFTEFVIRLPISV